MPPTITSAFPYTVHMINRRMGYGSVETRLTGYSGAVWGKATSRFSPAYGCHFIELTAEEYEACREDVFKACQLAARTWEPKIVLTPSSYVKSLDLPVAVQEFLAGYNLGMDGRALPDGATQAARDGHRAAVESDPAHFEEREPSRIPAVQENPFHDAMIGKPGNGEVKITDSTPEPFDDKTPYPTLRRIATAEGVDVDGKLKNAASLRVALRHARGARQPAGVGA